VDVKVASSGRRQHRQGETRYENAQALEDSPRWLACCIGTTKGREGPRSFAEGNQGFPRIEGGFGSPAVTTGRSEHSGREAGEGVDMRGAMRHAVLIGAGLCLLLAAGVAVVVGVTATSDVEIDPVDPPTIAQQDSAVRNGGKDAVSPRGTVSRQSARDNNDVPDDTTSVGEDAPEDAPEGPVEQDLEAPPLKQVNLVRPDEEYVSRVEASTSPLPYGRTLSEHEYREMSMDGAVDPRIRRRARAKYLLGFNEWRGRDSGWLGGFAFRGSDYPMLDELGYKPSQDTLSASRSGVVRRVDFTDSRFRVTMTISVSLKAGWAHEKLLFSPLMSSRGIGLSREERHVHTGDEAGKPVGDISLWQSTDVSREYPQAVEFARNNVRVRLTVAFVEFDIEKEDGWPERDWSMFQLDLYRLALEMDQHIVTQAVPAQSFEALREHSPRIAEFRLDPHDVREGHARIHLDVKPASGTQVSYDLKSEDNTLIFGSHVGTRFVPAPMEMSNSPPAIARIRPRTPAREHTVWMIAVGEDLLWAVARASFDAPAAPGQYR
jgi:hypothetical protein